MLKVHFILYGKDRKCVYFSNIQNHKVIHVKKCSHLISACRPVLDRHKYYNFPAVRLLARQRERIKLEEEKIRKVGSQGIQNSTNSTSTKCMNGNSEHTISFPFNKTQMSLCIQQKGSRSCLPSAVLIRCRRTSFDSLACKDLKKDNCLPSPQSISQRTELRHVYVWLHVRCGCSVSVLSNCALQSRPWVRPFLPVNLTIFFQLSLTSCSFHKAVCVCVCGGGGSRCGDYSVV